MAEPLSFMRASSFEIVKRVADASFAAPLFLLLLRLRAEQAGLPTLWLPGRPASVHRAQMGLRRSARGAPPRRTDNTCRCGSLR